MSLTRKSLEKKATKLITKKAKLDQQLDATRARVKSLEDQRHKVGNQVATINEVIKNLDELEKDL